VGQLESRVELNKCWGAEGPSSLSRLINFKFSFSPLRIGRLCAAFATKLAGKKFQSQFNASPMMRGSRRAQ